MKLYIFPPSSRALGIVALKNHLGIECEVMTVDLGKGDQRQARYVALNPNKKMPTLQDGDFVLWESNAILFYLAAKHPESGLWPSDLHGQADVVRWLAWESAHWDAESCGMVAFEKSSKMVLGLGPSDPAFVARGEQNFGRFAAVLDGWLEGKTWLLGKHLTIADFSIGAPLNYAQAARIPIDSYPEITRWYATLRALPAWQKTLAQSGMSAAAAA